METALEQTANNEVQIGKVKKIPENVLYIETPIGSNLYSRVKFKSKFKTFIYNPKTGISQPA